MLLEDTVVPVEEKGGVSFVLEAIDHLLDAIDRFDAPLTRELLRAAMLALVEECALEESRAVRRH